MTRNPFLLALALFTCAAAHRALDLPREAHASTALALKLDALVDRADVIVDARVIDKRVIRTLHGRIETEYRVTVSRSFLAGVGATFTFRLPGGVLPNGSGMLVAGMPEAACGDDVFVFLSPENAHGTRLPVGLAQGVFRVVADAHGARSVVRDAADLKLVTARGANAADQLSRSVHDHAAFTSEVAALVSTRAERAREPMRADRAREPRSASGEGR